MSSALLNSADVKAKAHSLGFSHVGFAPAEPVPAEVVAHYEQWLHEGRQGDMAYMEKHVALRRDPRLLLPGAKTVVSLAMSYHPGGSPTQPALAWYAQGRDYHDVIRERLKQLIERCFPQWTHPASPQTYPTSPQTHPLPLPCGEGGSYNDSPCSSESIYSPSCKGGAGDGSTFYRICVDTAPIFEKYWAWRCGLGWIGRHSQLVIPHEGSAFFLAELLLTAEADHYDNPIAQFSILNSQSSILNPHPCGSCRRCIAACPTGAISDGGMDARRCLSYLTIEHRGPLPDNVAPYLRECFYGCDRCQRACPHLSKAPATAVEDFRPSSSLLAMKRDDWRNLTPEQYRDLFRGSAVKRAKYEGLMRNIACSLS